MNLPIGLRNLGRVREIFSILVDYGFGYVFDQLDLGRLLPVGRRRAASPVYARIPGPRRLRMALADLGPVSIKLGQMLGARADLLPPAIVAELRALQDAGPQVTFEHVRGTVETELGRPLEECFREFEREPLASASLGQVHGAVLPDGRAVTVKVLRPGVRRVVDADLQILADAAQLLQRQVTQLQRYDLPSLVRRLSNQIEDEMMYTLEAHSADQMRESIAAAGLKVRVPKVIWELTTRQVLTTERIYGSRVDRLPPKPGLDKVTAARELGMCLLHQVFVDGFFHGDPHQGNVWIDEDGVVTLLDFGIVGYLDPRARWLLGELVGRVCREDMDGVMAALSELGALGPETDLALLRPELARIVGRFVRVPRRDFAIGELLSRMLRVLWLHHVRVPPELALAAKAFVMAEGIGCELDPDFDFLALAQPVLEEARGRLVSPSMLVDRALRAVQVAARQLTRLPSRVDYILSLLEHGSLRIQVEDPTAERRMAGLARSLNRLALGVLSGALLIGSMVYLSGPRHPLQVWVSTGALVVGVILGTVVVLSVLRPGRV